METMRMSTNKHWNHAFGRVMLNAVLLPLVFNTGGMGSITSVCFMEGIGFITFR